MTRDDDHGIRDLFAAGSRDLTPASASRTAHVLYWPVSRDPDVSSRCATVLSKAELRRADRFAARDDRALFEQRRAFRRFCGAAALRSAQPLSEILFGETTNGQPYLLEAPELRFSFSCCRFGLLGAWSRTHGIGVDVEDGTRELETTELAREFFTTAEAGAVAKVGGREGHRAFLQLWNLKEAALKSIGEGLPFGLDAFEFELDPTPRVVRAPPDFGGPSRFNGFLIEAAGGCAALVLRSLT